MGIQFIEKEKSILQQQIDELKGTIKKIEEEQSELQNQNRILEQKLVS